MKFQVMLKLVIVFLCLLGLHLASAQSEYVVLTRGDTLRGKVKYLNFGVDQKVQITDEQKKKSTFGMLEVRAFHLENEDYHLVKMYERYRFMKPVVWGGYLSLYAFQIENQISWDGRYLSKRDGTGLEVPNIGFKKRLAEYLDECTEVSRAIASGSLERTEINDIVNQYNSCISNAQVEIANSTRTPPDKPATEPSAWLDLETAVKASENLDDKETVLEMISEIKSKLARNEKVPNFMIDGLKKALQQQPQLNELLAKALNEMKETDGQ